MFAVNDAIWGLVGTAVGALASLGGAWLSGAHTLEGQREAKREERAEAAKALQRDTLLALQVALNDWMRQQMLANMEDQMFYRNHGRLNPQLSPKLDLDLREACRTLSMLIERVTDDDLRATFKDMSQAGAAHVVAHSPKEGGAERLTLMGLAADEKLGVVLRKTLQ